MKNQDDLNNLFNDFRERYGEQQKNERQLYVEKYFQMCPRDLPDFLASRLLLAAEQSFDKAKEIKRVKALLMEDEKLNQVEAHLNALREEERWRTDPLCLQEIFLDPVLNFHWRSVANRYITQCQSAGH
jgi:hypothetical protein